MSKLQIVYRAPSYTARMLQTLFAEYDIRAVVIDPQHASTMDRMTALSEVLVADSDAETARNIAGMFENHLSRQAEEPHVDEGPTDEGEWKEWPHCPGCGTRRATFCKICGTRGVDFLRGYLPAETHRDDSPPLLLCPTCDEGFVPEFHRHCQRCHHNFDDGLDSFRNRPSLEVRIARIVGTSLIVAFLFGLWMLRRS